MVGPFQFRGICVGRWSLKASWVFDVVRKIVSPSPRDDISFRPALNTFRCFSARDSLHLDQLPNIVDRPASLPPGGVSLPPIPAREAMSHSPGQPRKSQSSFDFGVVGLLRQLSGTRDGRLGSAPVFSHWAWRCPSKSCPRAGHRNCASLLRMSALQPDWVQILFRFL